jgi:hypothetical protein
MSTVSKSIADDVIAGKYPEDCIVKIVAYTNAWGAPAYGLIHARQPLDTYRASDFVIDPTTYWEAS